ncbi:hypothetical protein [Gordonia sp. (in: high G+C Gram-positive bacteria)]|uniref:hypothetical protein n=1 Tax=Gordonia sp. (in: high G+C Gram-positive bacteria) TaxID=84139 RepID=UPI0039E496F6
MKPTAIRTIAIVAATTAGAALAVAAPAHAEQIRHESIATCNSISPNVVDNPYTGRITTTQWLPNQRGRITVFISQSVSFFGYQTRPTLAWRNLSTGQRGQESTLAHSGLDGGGATFNDLRTGPGRVEIQNFTDSSNFAWTVRTNVCSTIVGVR